MNWKETIEYDPQKHYVVHSDRCVDCEKQISQDEMDERLVSQWDGFNDKVHLHFYCKPCAEIIRKTFF